MKDIIKAYKKEIKDNEQISLFQNDRNIKKLRADENPFFCDIIIQSDVYEKNFK